MTNRIKTTHIFKIFITFLVSILVTACETTEALKVTTEITTSSNAATAVLKDWQKQHSNLAKEYTQLEIDYIGSLKANFESNKKHAQAERLSMCVAKQYELKDRFYQISDEFIVQRAEKVKQFEAILDEELKTISLLIIKQQLQADNAADRSNSYKNDPDLKLKSKTEDAKYFALVLAHNGIDASTRDKFNKEIDVIEASLKTILNSQITTISKALKTECDISKGQLEGLTFITPDTTEFPDYETQFTDLINYTEGVSKGSSLLGAYIESNFTATGILKQASDASSSVLTGALDATKEKLGFTKIVAEKTEQLTKFIQETESKIAKLVETSLETGKETLEDRIKELNNKLTEKILSLTKDIENAAKKIGEAS